MPMELYAEYIKKQSLGPEALRAQREARLAYAPLISIVAEEEGAALLSLAGQSYSRFELVPGLEGARGEYILYLDARDRLLPEALFTFVSLLNRDREADLLYGDEDALLGGERREPFFKPDFSRITLYSYNAIGGPLLCAAGLARAAGGQAGFGEAAAYSYALRCGSRCRRPRHIPRVLMSRLGGRGRPEDMEPPRRALEACLARDRSRAFGSAGAFPGSFRVRLPMGREPCTHIVIPNRNGLGALRRLLESIEYHGGRYRLCIVDYGSTDPMTLRYYALLEKTGAAQVLRPGIEAYNYAKLCNLGAGRGEAEMLLFLSPSMEALAPDWLRALLEQALRPGAGAVGGRILDEAGNIGDCGQVLGLGGWAGSLYRGAPQGRPGEDMVKARFVNAIRAVSALSGDFLMVEAEKFFNAGCFDESFASAGAAMELCIRLQRQGLANIYTPYAQMRRYAQEPPAPLEEKELLRCYDVLRPYLIAGDAAFNPNYDYAKALPSVCPSPYPAILLNPLAK